MLPSNITQSITSSKIALANTTKPVTNAINSVPNPLDKVSSSVRKTSDELKSGTDKVVDNLFNNGNSCSGSGKAESIKNKLKSLGWTDNEINSINSIISEASGITRITSEDLSQITEDLKTDSEVDTRGTVLAMKTHENNSKEAALRDAHVVQDANYSISIKEPQVAGVATKPTNLFDADYSTLSDYPNSYGFVDTVKNWFKINKAKKTAELVLASGTNIKCDADGNVTWHIKGNFKLVIDGDYTERVVNSKDLLVTGNYHEGIEGSLSRKICGNSTSHIDGSRSVSIESDNTTSTKGNSTESTDGSYTNSSVGGSNIQSSEGLVMNSKSFSQTSTYGGENNNNEVNINATTTTIRGKVNLGS